MSAILSACGKYRYRLEREVGMGGPVYAYFGVNPSTADGSIDDATVRRWIGFTKVLGGRRLIVGNVFAYRAPVVRELRHPHDCVGPENMHHLNCIIGSADVLVPCWGSRDKLNKKLHGQLDALLRQLLASGKPVLCFGKTAGGDPKHPLMLGYETPLTPWGGP